MHRVCPSICITTECTADCPVKSFASPYAGIVKEKLQAHGWGKQIITPAVECFVPPRLQLKKCTEHVVRMGNFVLLTALPLHHARDQYYTILPRQFLMSYALDSISCNTFATTVSQRKHGDV